MSYYIIWGYKIRIAYDVYYFTNQKAFDEEIKNVKFDNRFSYDTMTLHITIVVLFGTICPGYGEDSLYYEIEHIYQWIKGKENNPNFNGLVSDAYTYAVNVLQREHNTIGSVIAWVIYYCNQHKQDAFAHQYYALSKRFPLEFRDLETEIDAHYKNFNDAIIFLEQNINKPKIIPFFKPYEKFGITHKNIIPYAKRGFKRFTKKLNHVRAYVNIFIDILPSLKERDSAINKDCVVSHLTSVFHPLLQWSMPQPYLSMLQRYSFLFRIPNFSSKNIAIHPIPKGMGFLVLFLVKVFFVAKGGSIYAKSTFPFKPCSFKR